MAETITCPSSVSALIGKAAEKWRSCEELPDHELLRLVVLRDLVHELHAQKSRFLSQGKRDDALSIREIETRIETLRTSKPLSGDLNELLFQPMQLKKRTRVLPDALFGVIEREKLERYDRQWEAAIASEAFGQGWRLWSLDARIEIPKIDEWNRRLLDSLWPDGIVLYVESGGAPASPAWQGRWMSLLHPQFKAPADILIDFSKWPGTQSTPSWRVLFSPRSL